MNVGPCVKFVACPVCSHTMPVSSVRCPNPNCNSPRDGNVILAAPSPVAMVSLTRQQIEDRAGRVARAITDFFNRGGEMMTENDLKEVIQHSFLYL